MTWVAVLPRRGRCYSRLADAIRADFARSKAENLVAAKEQKGERAKSGYPASTATNSPIRCRSRRQDRRGCSACPAAGPRSPAARTPIMARAPSCGIATASREDRTSPIWSMAARRPSLKLFRDALLRGAQRRAREKRAGASMLADDPDDPFNQCPKFAELAIIPTAAQTAQPMTTFCFHADPYVAGPYVEGDYDIELAGHRGIDRRAQTRISRELRGQALSGNNRAPARGARRAPPPLAVRQHIGLADRDPRKQLAPRGQSRLPAGSRPCCAARRRRARGA